MPPAHASAQPGRILVADDDPAARRLLHRTLAGEGHAIRLAAGGAEAVRLLEEEPFDLVLVDLAMSPVGGLEVLEAARRLRAETLVIVVAGAAAVESAIGALRRGAHDYILKPIRGEELTLLVDRALHHMRLDEERRRTEEAFQAERRKSRALARDLRSRFELDKVLGRSERMRQVRDLVLEVVNLDSPVLILGESGAGKGLLARVIHVNSSRSEGPFVEVNCSVYPEKILQSELFGHECGAFAEASKQKRGRLEMARGGTILLDQIGEVSLPTQALLLRFLQERSFERLGGRQTIESDVRVVAATARDIAESIRRGLFREDLYYRLGVIPIHVPPLRERSEDVPILAAEILAECAARLGRNIVGFTPEAMEAMLRHRWPGNIRELENVIERAVLLAHGSFIEPHNLPHEIASALRSTAAWLPCAPASSGEPLPLDEAERRHIVAVLRACGGNKKKAAATLGINRSSLYSKLKRLGITARRGVGGVR